MVKTLRWILLVWSIIAIPYAFTDVYDFETIFFQLIYLGLIIGITAFDIKKYN